MTANLLSQTPNEKKILNIATNFLNALKINDSLSIKKNISSKITISSFSKKQMEQLVDDLLMDRMNTYEYMLKISGHNIEQFLNKKYELIKFDSNNEINYEEATKNKDIKGLLYFIKFNIEYKYKKKKIEKNLIELDIILEGNNYKIFGFIF